jgi:WD40 repeat protein
MKPIFGMSIQRNIDPRFRMMTKSNFVSTHQKSRLLIGAGIATGLALIGAVYGLKHLQYFQRLHTLETVAAERNYEECMTQAQAIPKGSTRYTDAQMLLKQCAAGVNWQNVQVHDLRGHSDFVWAVAISSNGQILASGSQDKTIKLWQLPTGKLLRTLSGHAKPILSVAISPDGRTLASGSVDNTVKLWETDTGKLLHTLPGHTESIRSVAFSPDGRTLASSSWDNTIKLWETNTGKLRQTLSGHTDGVYSVTFSPDGRTLASASGDKTIKLWQLPSGKLLHTLSEHSKPVYAVVISPDGQTLISGSGDDTIKLWQLSTGKLLRTLDSDEVYSLALSSRGHLASGIEEDIKLWNLGTGELLRSPIPGHSKDITSVAISPNEKILVSSGKDKTMKLWRR